jgi:hypothetical protein
MKPIIDGLTPFFNMAADAMLKIEQLLGSEQSQPEFDENWFADVKTHTKSNVRKSGPSPPLSMVAAAAMLKIDY